jgi:hypothetical protein
LLRRPVENDNAAMETEPKRKRTKFQFSLSTLFVVTLFVAIWAFFMQFVKPFQLDGATIYPTGEWIMMTGAMIYCVSEYARAAARCENRMNRPKGD